MANILSNLRPLVPNTKERRVGRGVGSGLGKTGGRGQKGQKARSKGNINKVHFQGGQTPIQRRLPKRGFRSFRATKTKVINVSDLETLKNPETYAYELFEKGVVLKVLGDGLISKSVSVHAHRVSAVAKEKIEKAGGTIVLIPAKNDPSV